MKMLAEAMEKDLPYKIKCPALLICGEKDHAGSCIRYNKAWHKDTKSACFKYALWLLVVVKLLLPFPGIESKFHVLNFAGILNEIGNDRSEDISEENTDLLINGK